MPDYPKQELWVALAGPAVSVLIAALLAFIAAAIKVHFDWRVFRMDRIESAR